MLYLARSLSRLHFSSLMAVYAESNRENGWEFSVSYTHLTLPTILLV